MVLNVTLFIMNMLLEFVVKIIDSLHDFNL